MCYLYNDVNIKLTLNFKEIIVAISNAHFPSLRSSGILCNKDQKYIYLPPDLIQAGHERRHLWRISLSLCLRRFSDRKPHGGRSRRKSHFSSFTRIYMYIAYHIQTDQILRPRDRSNAVFWGVDKPPGRSYNSTLWRSCISPRLSNSEFSLLRQL